MTKNIKENDIVSVQLNLQFFLLYIFFLYLTNKELNYLFCYPDLQNLFSD